MKNTIFALLLTVWLAPFLALGQSAGLESKQFTPGSLDNVLISANIGFIRTVFPDYVHYSDYQYAFYPELEVDAEILAPYTRGGVYWGYWNDGVNSPLPVKDAVTFSYRSHILGARITFLPKKLLDNWLLPFGVFVGAARHFISEQCVGGFDIGGSTCNEAHYRDSRYNIHTLEAGLSSEFRIGGAFKIRGKVYQFIPLGNSEMDRYQEKRRGYSVGLGFIF